MSLTERARSLRRTMTDAERVLWRHLRAGQLGYKFRRQVPRGPYIVDFACLERKLIIEVDGGQHFENLEDDVRDRWLQEQGYRVLRFWNHEVLVNTQGVLMRIKEALEPSG